MYFFDGKHHIVFQSYESKMEMKNALSKCSSDLILGENASPQTAFYSVNIHLGWNGQDCFGIGICSEEHGLKPQLLYQSDISQLLLGFNREVVAVGIEDPKIHFRIRLDSLFHSFFVMEKPKKRILIFHEIGVVALEDRDNELWEEEEELEDFVIEDFEITGNHHNLIFMDAPPVSLNFAQRIQGINELNNPIFF
ncbi:MAG: hypothetical protein DRR19_21545 [Candidatus Parabeggiatoa sp. nov. 1]|nr:MAG: hypothetical protein DRR19_21545 [Gammaproteobacteria bacterium]